MRKPGSLRHIAHRLTGAVPDATEPAVPAFDRIVSSCANAWRNRKRSCDRGRSGTGRRSPGMLAALLATIFALTITSVPAAADEFYFSRARALFDAEGGATGLFRWNDLTRSQSQIGGDGSYAHFSDGTLISLDGLATDLSGNLFGFAVDDDSTADFIPLEIANSCTTNHRSRLVSINTSTAEVSFVGSSWLSNRHIVGAGFDGQGRLWAYDCVSQELLQISPTSGAVVGGPIATGISVTTGVDLDFAANGMGIVGYGGLRFLSFDPDAGWVANTPVSAQNDGFDSNRSPPYSISGVSFTSDLSARNGNPAAESCRLNLVENRSTDELGQVSDPFFANPAIAHKEADQYNPPTDPALHYNGGPGDAARVGGPVLPSCFYDWGDAPNSYGTLQGSNGAQHAIVAGGPYLGADLPDFEVDGAAGDGTGDNTTGTDDEDGVTIPQMGRGDVVDVEVEVGNAGPDTRLQGWIDWDGDGGFSGAGDQILIDEAVTSGLNTFTVTAPVDAATGTTYARFRIANEAGLGATGPASSGEVEDYAVTITSDPPIFGACDSTMYLSLGSSSTQLVEVDTSSNPFDFPPIGERYASGYNGIGYDPNTNYIYAVRWDDTSSRQRLLRIDANGDVDDMGQIRGGGINVGDFAGAYLATGTFGTDGFFYVKLNSATDRFFKIDIHAGANEIRSERIDLTFNGNSISMPSADWAWHQGLLYAHDQQADRLYTVDPGTGAVTIIGGSNTPDGAFGSMISASNGVFGRHNGGGFYRFDPATGEATLISTSPTGGGDGAKCPGTAVELPADTQITKNDGTDTYADGGQTTYEIVVSNNGPFGVQNAVVNDPLPDDVTEAEWTCGNETGEATCSVASGTDAIEDVAVSLPDGASVTFELTIEVPAGHTGDLTNTATVENPGDVRDPDLENNEASDTDTQQSSFGSCDATMYLSQDDPTGLYEVDASQNPFPVNPVGTVSETTYNATAFHPTTHYLYAIQSPSNNLVRIGDDGSVQELGPITGDGFENYGDSFNTGEIGPNGNYYVKGSENSTAAWRINVETRTAVALTLSDPVFLSDWAWHGGQLYGHSHQTGELYSIDPNSGTVTPIGNTGITNTGFGGMFGGTDGVHGSLDSGGFYRFDLDTGAATKISDLQGSANNDGAKCATTAMEFEVDLAISKDDGQEIYAPGEVTYDIVVSNSDPFGAQNALVDDPLPDGITDAEWTCGAETNGGSCVVASGTGAIDEVPVNLPAGASVTFELTLDVPMTFTGDLTNTAEVIAPEGTLDQNPDNNTDTDTDTLQRTFECDATMYLSQGNPTGLHDFDTSDNPFDVNPVGPVSSERYNAIAYNPLDDYIYGMLLSAPDEGTVARIGQDGSVMPIGAIDGLDVNSVAGEIGPDGTYYIVSAGELYRIDLSTGTADSITLNPGLSGGHDLAWHDGSLWIAAPDNGPLQEIDPESGTVTPHGSTGVADSFGAMFGATNGVFGGNNAGGFYKFDLTTGQATQISNLPGSSGNDGAKCATKRLDFPVDLEIVKDNGRDVYVPGETTYEIVVSNDGLFGVQNALVNDSLPTGISDDDASWTCTPDSGGATCGEPNGTGTILDAPVSLPVGASVTFELTIDVPFDFTGDLVNTVEVTTPEGSPDVDLTDNEASDTDTPQPDFGQCDATMYLAQDIPTALYDFDTSDNPFDVNPVGDPSTERYNAIAYNPDDNYIYGILLSADEPGTLARIGSDGSVEDLGPVEDLGVNSVAGEIDPEGNYYVVSSSTLYRIDIATMSASSDSLSESISVQDLAWHDGMLYAAGASGGPLYAINPANGDVDTIGTGTGVGNSFGGMFGASNGVFGSNNGGGFYQFDLAEGEATLISSLQGSGNNDGAKCPSEPLTFPVDLAITKDDGELSFVPGEDIEYTIEVTNNGPFGVQGALVNDTLPDEVSDAQWTCSDENSNGVCVDVSGTGAITDARINLPVGETVVFTQIVTVPEDTTGELINTATVSTPDGSPDEVPENDTAKDRNVYPLIETRKDLIDESGDITDVAEPGETLTYRVTLRNEEDFEAPHELIDDIDDNTDYVANSASIAPDDTTDPLVWNEILIPAGGTVEVTYQVTVDPNLGDDVTEISNAATEDCEANPDACVVKPTPGTVTPSKALTNETGEILDVAEPGETLTYTVTLTNDGAGAALHDLTDHIDENVTYDSDSATVDGEAQEPDQDTGPLIWNDIPVPAGGTVLVVYDVTVAEDIGDDTEIRNAATESCADNPDACVVTPLPGTAVPSKELTGEEGGQIAGVAEPGETLTYTVTLTNDDAGATLHDLVDDIDENTEYVANSAVVDGTTQKEPSGTDPLTWEDINVPGEGSTTVVYKVKVDDELPDDVTQIRNAATEDCEADPDACVTTPTPGTAVPSKALTDEDGDVEEVAEPGELLTYTVTLTNTSTETDALHDLSDNIDDNTAYEPGTATVGDDTREPTGDGDPLNWDDIVVPAGGEVDVVYTVRVKEDLDDDVTEISNAATEDCEAIPDACVVTPLPGDVTPTKRLTEESGTTGEVAEPGETLTFTVTLTNDGGGAASYDLNDDIHEHTSYVANSAEVNGEAREPAGDDPLVWENIIVPANDSIEVVYSLIVHEEIPEEVTEINNLVHDGIDPPECEEAPEQCVIIDTADRGIELVKAGEFVDEDNDGIIEAGDHILYTFSVRNAGNVVLTDVVPEDDGPSFNGQPGTNQLSAFQPASATLDPDQVQDFTATYELSQADIDNGAGVEDGVDNAAIARGYAHGDQTTGTPVESEESVAVLALPEGTEEVSITKVAGLRQVRRGEKVPYVIRVTSASTASIGPVIVTDRMPSGFRYVEGSATVDGVEVTPTVSGLNIVFDRLELGADDEIEIRLQLLALSSAGPGRHVNKATVTDPSGNRLAHPATAAVEIVIEPVFDCAEIIGKVFDDQNRNGYQDEGEPGLPSVRVVTVKGWLITTDEHGRFHIACAELPDQRIGTNFIMKLDTRTLPTGYRLTTENPRVVRLTAGKMTRINFGASIGRVVRLDLKDDAFVPGSTELQPRWASGIDRLIKVLSEEQSVLRLSYIDAGADSRLAQERLDHLKRLVAERWRARDGRYRLDIETRVEAGR